MKKTLILIVTLMLVAGCAFAAITPDKPTPLPGGTMSSTPAAKPAGAPELAPDVKEQARITAGNLVGAVQDGGPKMEDRITNEFDTFNTYLVKRQVIRQSLTRRQVISLFRDLGFWRKGGATWGRGNVNWALTEGVLVGRTSGTTISSGEWKSPASKEELAAGIGNYNVFHNNDPAAHPAIQAEIADVKNQVNWIKIIGYIIAAILFIWFLWWLIGRIVRPRPVVRPNPGFPAAPIVPPFGGGGAPAVPAGPVTPMANGRGRRYAP